MIQDQSGRRKGRSKGTKGKIERLLLLAELSQVLNSSLDHQEVKKRAIEATTRLMRAQVGSLLLIDEEKKQLYFEVALGDEAEAVKKIVLKWGQGIAGWAAQHGKPLMVNAPERDPRFFKGVDGKVGFKTRNLLCVPLRVKEKVIGVLQAVNKVRGGEFDQEDLSLFGSLADLVAVALDNARLYRELEEMFFQFSESLADAIEKRDPYTGGHTRRVTTYSLAIARFLPLTLQERKWLRIAAVLHDIGKIGVKDQILLKPEPLSQEEYSAIKQHSTMGAEILEHIRMLKEVVPGVKHHHEQMDGTGYPTGLKGKEIPRLAKIVAVADTYDAMTTDRPYRRRLDPEVAIEELTKYAGARFDRRVVRAFVKAYRGGELRV